MKKLLVVLGIAAFGLTSFNTNLNQKEIVEVPLQSSWQYIGEREGVEFYWKIISENEGKLKAKNTTGKELYVEFDYTLLDNNKNEVLSGYGGFGNISAYDDDIHPITDWSKGRLRRATSISISDIQVSTPY